MALGEVLKSSLVLGHAVLAGALKSPRLAIDEEEGEKLAEALDAVLAHYVSVNVDAKMRDWLNLLIVGGGIYGPRVAAAMLDAKSKPARPAPQPAAELKPTMPSTTIADIPGVGKVEVPIQ